MSQVRQKPPRDRGVYVPAQEVQLYLHNGWTVIDDCAGSNEVLMTQPDDRDASPQFKGGLP